MSGRLAGRRVLVTGAASGVGRATSRRFAREGARLALLDRDADGLDAVAAETGAFAAVVELRDPEAIAAAVTDAAAALDGLDGVVNVAGIGSIAPLGDVTLEAWNTVIGVNLTAPFLVLRAALPHLRAAGDATVVNVASALGLRPELPGLGAYSASKGGLVSFGRAMALELAPAIRVNTVCPGAVDTPMLPDAVREAATGAGSPYALQRVATAEEIAEAILFLTSRESSYATGTTFAVDGGRSFH